MKKLGIIHTTPATIASLNSLVREIIGDVEIINFLDDSILGDMCRGHEVEYVRNRWISYAVTLGRLGADAVLSACSTVGAFAEEADRLLAVPVYRIDEAMCARAAEQGKSISVFATLSSTLEPTTALLRRKAKELGKDVAIHPVLVEGAYEALMSGDKPLHDQKIREAVEKWLPQSDVAVLAQASMASAVEPGSEAAKKLLTSPRLGIEKLKKDLGL
ncbi:MAG: aspartate/glutamate racemase family protein [Eubacteriales bacterium]|nr:aspartate/glutamate racemase family protein [Eubacteriales bacterium]